MEVGTANVPAFLTKLWKLVEDPTYADLISWSSSGRSFIIRNPTRFSKELLPLYFKHNNMASFIRQLNMYGFRKLTSIEHSGLRSERDEMEFYHQYFLRQQENLLEYIKRKASSSGSSSSSNGQHNGTMSNGTLSRNGSQVSDHATSAKVEEVHELLTSIMQRQDSQENFRVSVQNEYSSLWKEIVFLRQQNAKQQTIVQRLIQFLMSLVQNQRNVPPTKRKATLMIDGVDGSSCSSGSTALPRPTKRLNLEAGPSVSPSAHQHSPSSSTELTHHHEDRRSDRSEHAIRTGIMDAIASGLSNGPVIHDVTDDVLEDDLEAAANSNPIVSMSNGDRSDQTGPLFQDIDLEILNQVLEFTGTHVAAAVEENDCSKDGEDFPLTPEHLMSLEAVRAAPLVNGLVSELMTSPSAGKMPAPSSSCHGQHSAPDQIQPHAQSSTYWHNYEPVPSVSLMSAHSPDESSHLSSAGTSETADYLLDPETLLEDKDSDLVLMPGPEAGPTTNGHSPRMSLYSSTHE